VALRILFIVNFAMFLKRVSLFIGIITHETSPFPLQFIFCFKDVFLDDMYRRRKGQSSVKKHNYNIVKMMVFIAEQNKKIHVSAYIGHHQVFTTFLLKSLI